MKRVTYINLILGVWLIVAPIVFGLFATNMIGAWTDVALGVVLTATSWWIVAERPAQIAVSGFQLLCGAWLIVGPFVLRYEGTLNDMIVGVFVVIVSALETWTFWRPHIRAA